MTHNWIVGYALALLYLIHMVFVRCGGDDSAE
jgi:hypothetical protein